MITQEKEFYQKCLNELPMYIAVGDMQTGHWDRVRIICELARLDRTVVRKALSSIPDITSWDRIVAAKDKATDEHRFFCLIHEIAFVKNLGFPAVVALLLANFPDVVEVIRKPYDREREKEFDNIAIAQITGIPLVKIRALREIPWGIVKEKIENLLKFTDVNLEIFERTNSDSHDAIEMLAAALSCEETLAAMMLATAIKE